MDNVDLNDIKGLENSDIITAYEEVDKYIKYLKDSILDEEAPAEETEEAS